MNDRMQRGRFNRMKRWKIALLGFITWITFCIFFYLSSISIVTSEEPFLHHLEDMIPDMQIHYNGTVYQDKETVIHGDAFSGGTASYTRSSDAVIIFEFEGSRVEWFGFYGESNGLAEIFMDHQSIRTVDLYSVNPSFQKSIFKSELLQEGRHVMEIRSKGRSHADSKDQLVNIDNMNVWQNGQLQTFENDAPTIRYIHADHYNYLNFIQRKLIHVAEFFVLTTEILLLCRVFGISGKRMLIVPGLMLIWALADEFHQSFVPSRTPSWFDVGMDAAGISAAVLLYQLVILFVSGRKKRK